MNAADRHPAAVVARVEADMQQTMRERPGLVPNREAAAHWWHEVTAELIADRVVNGSGQVPEWLEEYRYLRDLTREMTDQRVQAVREQESQQP